MERTIPAIAVITLLAFGSPCAVAQESVETASETAEPKKNGIFGALQKIANNLPKREANDSQTPEGSSGEEKTTPTLSVAERNALLEERASLVRRLGEIDAALGGMTTASETASDLPPDLPACERVQMVDMLYYIDDARSDTEIEDPESAAAVNADVMRRYTQASALINDSQLCLAEALELKEIVTELEKEREILAGGTSMSSREIKKQRKLTADANQAIADRLGTIETLTPEQRADFGSGLTAYLMGTHSTFKLIDSVGSYGNVLKQASTGGFMKNLGNLVGAGATIATLTNGLQPHVKTLIDSGKLLLDYSQSNNIAVSEDATSEFANLLAWGGDDGSSG